MSSEDDEFSISTKKRKGDSIDFNIKKPSDHAKVKLFFNLNLRSNKKCLF